MNGQCCTQSTDEISHQNKSETNKQNKQAKKERKRKKKKKHFKRGKGMCAYVLQASELEYPERKKYKTLTLRELQMFLSQSEQLWLPGQLSN